MTLDVTIVIPAYNEAERLAEGFRQLAPVLEQLGEDRVEVVVVDDGSSDDTLRRAGEIYGHLPHTFFVQQPHNRGKGAAVRLGVAIARGERVVVTDADMAIDPVAIPAMVTALASAHLVPGSRTVDGHIRYDSLVRTISGGVFNHVVRHYTGTRLRDTQCGLKGFQRGAARVLGLLGMVDRFAYDAEMLYLAEQLRLVTTPLHVTWHDVTGSKVRLGADSLSMLHDIRQLRSTRYENPVVELRPGVAVAEVERYAREARVQGLVIARGTKNDLVVLPRDGALGGLGIAAALEGVLRVTGLDELRGRSFDAV